VRALAAGANVRDRPFDASRAPGQGQTEGEEHLIGAIHAQPSDETQMSALILARRGQGLFKQRVRQVEVKCRITGVTASSICARATANRGATAITPSVSTARTVCCAFNTPLRPRLHLVRDGRTVARVAGGALPVEGRVGRAPIGFVRHEND
jgi:hypothetical protein